MLIQLLILFVLILLSGFFSGTETAFTSLSAVQIQGLSEDGRRRGRLVAQLCHQPDILLATILIGNNLVNIAASALATKLTIELFGSSFIGAMTGVMTFLILVFGEVTPKHVAILNNTWICLHTAYLIWLLSYLFRPVIWVITGISRLITRLVGSRRESLVSFQEILRTVHLAETAGVLEPYEEQMVKNVFRLNDVNIGTILTHRTDVFSLEQRETVGAVADRVIASGFSRIPVYEDDPEYVVGVVLVKDLLRQIHQGNIDVPLKQLMLRPSIVLESVKADEMLWRFKSEKLNMAIVIDEYGGLAGIVTQEDIVEEIFGELYDEHERMGSEKITFLGHRWGYRILADTSLLQVRDTLNLRLSERERKETFGWYVASRLGHIPARGEKVRIPEGEIVVDQIHGNRLVSCRFVHGGGASPGSSEPV
jgi:CBS domain containing-hemolysin-like protein